MPDEGQRILDLMNELAADHAFATGDRRFPRPVAVEDAVFITAKLQEAMDDGTEVRARKAEEDGLKIACTAGCHYCCEQPILVWLPEAIRVAEFLRRPENAAIRDAFLAAYPAWRDAAAAALEQVAEGGATQDWERFMTAHVAAWKRRVLCAFNRDGLCTIYAARPIICRHHHALDTADHCRVDDDSGVPPAYLSFQPLDDFVSRAKLLSSALHHAVGGRRMRMVALCKAVAELLEEHA